MFKIILITIMSLVADSVNNKPWKGEEYVSLFRRTPIPIWRRTPLPIPIWRRTPPPIFTIRDEKIQKKSMNQTDDGKKLSMKWVVKDIYYPNKKDLNRQVEIKNMGRWILRWDLYDKKFKFGKYNRTDYLMYSRWRFLYEPPISNIIDFFKNL